MHFREASMLSFFLVRRVDFDAAEGQSDQKHSGNFTGGRPRTLWYPTSQQARVLRMCS